MSEVAEDVCVCVEDLVGVIGGEWPAGAVCCCWKAEESPDCLSSILDCHESPEFVLVSNNSDLVYAITNADRRLFRDLNGWMAVVW